MNISTTIRRAISALLIVVFALGITPVAILHDIAANHKDVSYSDKNQKGGQYSKAGINCNAVNFVAEAQFLTAQGIRPIAIAPAVSSYKNFFAAAFYSRHHFYAELRGPPFTA